MNPMYAVLGVLLIAIAVLDALWTTLWVDGHAGPVTGWHNRQTRRLLWRLAASGNHRLLSLTGPLILVSSVLVWALLLWAGWLLLLSADPDALIHSHHGTPATLTNRIYFTGYTMFTLGNGDYSPQGPWAQMVTAGAALSGLFLVTLVVTYQVSLLQAVTQKRSFASQVVALGDTAEDFVIHSWTGRDFSALELQIVSLTEQLNTISERHEAYPMLHHYHAAREHQSVPVGLTIFDDALTLLEYGVHPDHRPAPAAVRCARESVWIFVDTLRSALVSASDHPAPLPRLERLRAAGIPTVTDAEFAERVRELDSRRRLLRGFLEGEHRRWPGQVGAEL